MFANLATTITLLILAGIVLAAVAISGGDMNVAQSNAAIQNIGIYAKAVGHYAEQNPTATGVSPAASLSLPTGYTSTYPYVGYVENGNAWVYMPAGGSMQPSELLRLAGAPLRYLGIKNGTTAVDGTGAVVFGTAVPLPAAIPNGAAVYLARQLLPPPSPPAGSPTSAQPSPPPPLVISGPPVAVVGSPYASGPGTAWVPPSVPPLPPTPPNGNPSQPPVTGPTYGPQVWFFECNTVHTNNKTGTYDGCSITPPESTEYPSPWSPLQQAGKYTGGIAMNNTTPCSTLGSYALSPIKVNPSAGILNEQDGFECGHQDSSGNWVFQ